MYISLKIKKLNKNVKVPEYQSKGASGFDLESTKTATILPGLIEMFPTGLSMSIPEGWEGQVRPRSGLAIKHGVTVVNTPGTIDADYRGEIIVGLINLSPFRFKIKAGDRIAQMVIAPVRQAQIQVVNDLSKTERGAGGFGSTGGFLKGED